MELVKGIKRTMEISKVMTRQIREGRQKQPCPETRGRKHTLWEENNSDDENGNNKNAARMLPFIMY